MQSVNNFNGSCMRFLFSPISGVLCFHIFNLNPFPALATQSGLQTLASFKGMSTSGKKQVQSSMFRKASERSDATEFVEKAGAAAQKDAQSDEAERLRVPVFLNRNRRKMKQLRKNI